MDFNPLNPKIYDDEQNIMAIQEASESGCYMTCGLTDDYAVDFYNQFVVKLGLSNICIIRFATFIMWQGEWTATTTTCSEIMINPKIQEVDEFRNIVQAEEVEITTTT